MSKHSRAVKACLKVVLIALAGVACQGILGIEKDRQDRGAASYDQGYEGCNFQDGCNHCLSEQHRCLCEGNTNCNVSGGTYPGCENGDCGGCSSEIDQCYCEGGSMSECQGGSGGNSGIIIQPGTDGGGFDPAVCAEVEVDPCAICVCEQCGGQLTDCFNDADCSAIFGCMAQYDCDPFPQVAFSCYAPEYCATEIDAAGGLGSSAYGQALGVINCAIGSDCPCVVDPVDTCTFDTGCLDCTDCYSQCMCENSDAVLCGNQCGVVPPCSPTDGCASCQTCLGQCTCLGDTVEFCVSDCGSTTTCTQGGDCATCATFGQQCVCEGGTPYDCLTSVLGSDCPSYFGSLDGCNTCSCSSCPGELLACVEDAGCLPIVSCMRSTGCVGAECDSDATCGPVLASYGGVTGTSFGLAETLDQCRANYACPCDTPPPTDPIVCGTSDCYPYYLLDPNDGVLPACCYYDDVSTMDYCGLDVSAVIDSTCEPLYQTGVYDPAYCAGYYTDAASPPYYGAYLEGCCRPTGTCGFNDTVTGLGCVPSYLIDSAGVEVTCPYPIPL